MSATNGDTPPDISDILGSIGAEESAASASTTTEETNSEESSNAEEKGGSEETNVIETTRMTAEDLAGNSDDLAKSIFQDLDVDSSKATAKAEEAKATAEAAEKASKEAADKAAEDAAKAAEKTGGEEEDPHASVLEKEVPGGAHAKESTRSDWEAMRTAAKAYKQAADENRAQLAAIAAEKAALEEKLTASPTELPEEVKSELEHLRSRVVEFDVSLLPEIREKYDKKIDSTAQAILGWFDDATKDPARSYEITDEEGNPTGKLSGLTPEVVGILKAQVAARGFTGYNWAAWIGQCLESGVINGVEARQLENTVAHAMTLNANRNAEITQRTQSWAQEQAQRQLSNQQEMKTVRENATKIGSRVAELLTEAKEKNEWAREPGQLSPKATAEEKVAHAAEVQEFQVKTDRFQKTLKAYYNSQGIRFEGDDKIPHMTPEEFRDLIADAFSVADINRQKSEVEAKLAEAEKELNEFRSGGSTAPKSATRGGSSEGSKPATKQNFTLTPESVLGSIG